MFRIPRRPLLLSGFLVLLVTPCALIGFALFQAVAGSNSSASGQPAEVYFVAGSASSSSRLTQLSPAIATARKASSIGEVESLSGGDPAVVMIDEEYAKTLAPGSIRQLAVSGYAVIGLNVPLDALVALTGFKDELGGINPAFSGGLNSTPAEFVGPFFTLVWRSRPGANPAYWAQSQHELTPRMFAVIIGDYKLRVRGLIANQDATVVPLEQYGPAPN